MPDLGLSEEVFAAEGDEPPRRSAEPTRPRAGRRGAGSRGACGRGEAEEPAAEAEEAARKPKSRPQPSEAAAGAEEPEPRGERTDLTRLLFVGLTGGIGSGKSEALAACERLGAAVLSSDAVVHELLGTEEVRDLLHERWGDACWPAARSTAGPSPRSSSSGPDELAWLEGELFPRVGERMAAWRAELERRGREMSRSSRCRCCSRRASRAFRRDDRGRGR